MTFRPRFGRSPVSVVSAPGRVNLIGEHTDYSGLPVLPFAIDHRVRVSAAPHRRIEIVSTAGGHPFVDRSQDEGWHRYVRAVLEVLGHEGGVMATVEGDLPAGGGLSSSTALTMALIAALEGAAGRWVEPAEVARLAAMAERSAGVESGEMDQTVIAHARAGHAMHIDFPPEAPVHRHIPLPETAAVVVAFSGKVAEKGGDARAAYNARVVGGRVATAFLAHRLGIGVPSPLRLGSVADSPDALALAGDLPEVITTATAARATGVDELALASLTRGRFPSHRPVPVRAVARHVLAEAERVARAERALTAGDLEELGELLKRSHASLQEFGASTPALDRLVEAMGAAGALGARLTGAGFGGNAIALCRPDRVREVVAAALAATGGPAFEVRASPGLVIEV